ncbi:MAG: HypC/HybG/HupF family hydrogenase formation chaperone [Gemmatimonadetes bacterium]|nr:HypC/HybG/HupF family hydrogenase formation chaperone [Gemmatimonadota bacterium]
MCLGIPGQVKAFVDPDRQIAKVDVSGVRRNVNVALVLPDGLDVGDWVLVHVGFAMARIDEAEARDTLEFLRTLDEELERELDDLRGSDIA